MTTYVTRQYYSKGHYTEQVEYDGHLGVIPPGWEDDDDWKAFCPECGYLKRVHKDTCPQSEEEAANNIGVPIETQ